MFRWLALACKIVQNSRKNRNKMAGPRQSSYPCSLTGDLGGSMFITCGRKTGILIACDCELSPAFLPLAPLDFAVAASAQGMRGLTPLVTRM